jgi:hypothetical protein
MTADAEGEPDTTTSAPMIAAEKANGEKTQMAEPQGESKAKLAQFQKRVPLRFGDHCSSDTRLPVMDHDGPQAQVSSRPCLPGMTITPASGGRTRRWHQETTCSL